MTKFKKTAAIMVATIIFSSHGIASSSEESMHIYNNVAIKSMRNQLLIYKSRFISNPIRSDLPKFPKMTNVITSIKIDDLHVPEEACLEIDATLCTESQSTDINCFDKCITNGPEFVTYDEKRRTLFVDAETDVSGTGGTPQFLFSVDPARKKIDYLNTVISPYTAHLSPDGKHIAIASAWNEISVIDTKTGNLLEISNEKGAQRGKKCLLEFIGWINDNEIKYNESNCQNGSSSENKIFNVNRSPQDPHTYF
jgi:hypothetical protein